MTNGEKYKTAKERAEAFYRDNQMDAGAYVEAERVLNWLDLEAVAEDPLPCPFCGSKTWSAKEWNGLFRVRCSNPDCWYSSCVKHGEDAAIAAHNRVARAAAKTKEMESAKIDLGVDFLKVKEANDANA